MEGPFKLADELFDITLREAPPQFKSNDSKEAEELIDCIKFYFRCGFIGGMLAKVDMTDLKGLPSKISALSQKKPS